MWELTAVTVDGSHVNVSVRVTLEAFNVVALQKLNDLLEGDEAAPQAVRAASRTRASS